LEVLVLVDEGNPEFPEKNPWRRRKPTTNSTHFWQGSGSNPSDIKGEASTHHCAIPPPHCGEKGYEL